LAGADALDVALEVALEDGEGVVTGPGGLDEWPVKPPITSTTTNAAACASTGAASLERPSVTTGQLPPVLDLATLAGRICC
jgi:hypothetical protein